MQISETTKTWLHGLGAAFIGAIGSSVSTMVVAPDKFNFNTEQGILHLLASWVVSGIIAAGAYLRQSPLPGTPIIQQTLTTPDGTTATATAKQE